jgi:hypothetical protein
MIGMVEVYKFRVISLDLASTLPQISFIMSYKSVPIPQYCSFTGRKHLEGISFCTQCGSGQVEVVDLSKTPPRTTGPAQPPSRVAAVQRDIVNNRLKTAQNTRNNAGSNALSSRAMTRPCTITQNFLFTFVLISESFYYTSQEDREYDLPTILTRKHIGIYLTLTCCIIHINYYNKQRCYTASKLPFPIYNPLYY